MCNLYDEWKVDIYASNAFYLLYCLCCIYCQLWWWCYTGQLEELVCLLMYSPHASFHLDDFNSDSGNENKGFSNRDESLFSILWVVVFI